MLAKKQYDAHNQQDAQHKKHTEITRTIHKPKGLSHVVCGISHKPANRSETEYGSRSARSLSNTSSIHFAPQDRCNLPDLFHQLAKFLRQNRLHAIGERLVRLVMHFDEQSIRAHRNGRAR